MKRFSFAKLFSMLFIMILALSVVIPLFWTFSASFMHITEVFDVPMRWLPKEIQVSSYVRLFTQQPFFLFYFNSLVVAATQTASNVFFATLIGLAVSNKYHFLGKNAAFAFIFGTIMLPFQLIMIPLYIMMRNLGLLDSRLGVIIPALITSFGVFLLRQHINELPNDYLDAARIDGASEWKIFLTVITPLCKPMMAALAVFSFMNSWNDFLWPLIVINSPARRTLTLAVAYLQGHYATDYPIVMAAAVISSFPIIAVFLANQRHFIRSMTMTGIKG